MRIAHALCCSLFFASGLAAQTLENLTPLRFTTTPVSVRGAGLGATSLPFEHDVAAAPANPAAVAAIKRPAFSASVAGMSFATVATVFEGNGAHSFRNREHSAGLSHVAAAVPLRSGAVSLWYRNEPHIQAGGPFTRALPGLPSRSGVDCSIDADCGYAFFPSATAISLKDTRYGAAAAWRFGSVSIGAGAELIELNERWETPRMVFGARSGDHLFEELGRTISDRDVVAIAGISWQATPRLTVAGSYAGGGSFARQTTICETAGLNGLECSSAMDVVDLANVRRADTLRAGALYRMSDRFRMTVEAVGRNYSVLSRESYSLTGVPAEFPYRDVIELHSGVEWILPGAVPIAFRAGWWRDPSRVNVDEISALIAEDVDHLTAGVGVEFSGLRFDVAFDQATRSDVRRVAVGLTRSF